MLVQSGDARRDIVFAERIRFATLFASFGHSSPVVATSNVLARLAALSGFVTFLAISFLSILLLLLIPTQQVLEATLASAGGRKARPLRSIRVL
ncbi:hypothetical protein KEM55_008631 [Ascosphaera atra]|nr:hypothetical protein KEM55_008631 [Ascosphaera atra]